MRSFRASFGGYAGLLCLMALVCCASGCGESRVDVYPTEALLMIDDKPFGPTKILLVPTAEGGRSVAGEVDENGMVTFTTYEIGDGAPAGDYRVAVGMVMAPPPAPFPAVYRDMEKSPLTIRVEAKEKNEIAMAMDSKVGGRMAKPGDTMADMMRSAYEDPAFSAGATPGE